MTFFQQKQISRDITEQVIVNILYCKITNPNLLSADKQSYTHYCQE